MGVFDGQYPHDLGRVIGHAKRLMKVLAKMERARKDVWFVGRPGEIRGVVSLALADWRSGARDSEVTGRALSSYIDTLHRGASRKLRCGRALECCAIDDVITAVAADEARSSVGIDTSAGDAQTQGTNAPTARAGWADSPEMLARFRDGLGLVDTCARIVVRSTGEGCAAMDDLRAFGREGLLDAARAFDEGRGVPFDRWASLRIRSAMIDGVRRWGALPASARRELRALEAADLAPNASHTQDARESSDLAARARLGASGGDQRSGMDGDLERLSGRGLTPEDAVAQAELASLVREIVGKLPTRERELVERSYFKGQTLEQAAASMGVSRSWARRVHAHAIETMQRALRESDGVHFAGRGKRPLPERS
jgi:RNA polymerase sigma factor for flagellar operon FliA